MTDCFLHSISINNYRNNFAFKTAEKAVRLYFHWIAVVNFQYYHTSTRKVIQYITIITEHDPKFYEL